MKAHATTVSSVLIIALVAGAVGCKKEENKQTESAAQSTGESTQALPAGLFVEENMADAKSVAEVKADEKLTGKVVVHGRIGGRKKAFVDGMAVFLLADASMKSCAELHGDRCPTPWDYCCEPRDSLAAKTATVQIVGDDGKPLRAGVEGEHGMKPLVHVTIDGEIASRDAGSLVINARKIYVAKEG